MSDPSHSITARLPVVVRRQLGTLYRSLRRARRQTRLRIDTALASIWRRLLFRTTVIAITGSLGKTTTRELLYAVLSESSPGSRTPRNSNNDRGVVTTLLAARPWHRHCVVEIGIEKPGDMARRARLVRPDVAVFLNVGHCHFKGFGTIRNVLAEKRVLFDHVRSGGMAVLNVVDPEVRSATLPAGLNGVTFAGWRAGEPAGDDGLRTTPDCRLVSATSNWPDPLTVEIEHADDPDEPYRVRYVTQLHGEHWANAVVAAVTTARAQGVSTDDIARGLARVPNWSRRLEPIPLARRQATYVRDDYNGSIETYRAALAWLGQAQAGRRIVIYADAADMRASSGPRTRLRDLTRMAASQADHLVPITPYADKAERTARACGLDAGQVTPLGSVHDAIAWCRASLRQGDILLCKGRGEQKLERVYLGLFGEVACQLESCALKRDCADCSELGFKVTPAMLAGTADVLASTEAGSLADASTDGRVDRTLTPS